MEIMEFFKTKRTYRKFKQDRIPEDVIRDIVEAARIASSAANRQGLKFVVVKEPGNVKAVNDLVKWAGYLPKEVGTPGPSEIPTLFVAVLQDTTVCPANDLDAGLAIANMTSAAWAYGVGSCIMGAIDRPKLKEMLNIPEESVLNTMIAFGYPSKASRIVDMNGDIKYYLDENGDTCVPKRSFEEVIRFYD